MFRPRDIFFSIGSMSSKFTIYTKLFDEMISNPEKIRHCLFVGSPGSGKTTAAQEFCKRWIGPPNQWIGRVLFLNASDERSLEAVRSKIFPFARSTLTSIFQNSESNSKVIVFDEAETLTEQAQLSLRPLLNYKASEICVLFLCNSSSRIHPSLLHRFCVLPFYPSAPSIHQERIQKIMKKDIQIAPLDTLYTRADLRSYLFHTQRVNSFTKLFSDILHCPHYDLEERIRKEMKFNFSKEILSQLLFGFLVMNLVTIEKVIQILPLGTADVLRVIPEEIWVQKIVSWIQEVREKFDDVLSPKA